MTLLWITSPFLDLDYLAGRLYGTKSRLYTVRLRKKIQGVSSFEAWELEKLAIIREELMGGLHSPKGEISRLRSTA